VIEWDSSDVAMECAHACVCECVCVVVVVCVCVCVLCVLCVVCVCVDSAGTFLQKSVFSPTVLRCGSVAVGQKTVESQTVLRGESPLDR
jgi:hypothetical protein